MARGKIWWDRVGAASGVLFFVLLFVSQSAGSDLGTITDPSKPGTEIAQVLVENRADIARGVYLSLLAVLFLLWFLAYLRRHLADAEGEGGWMASVAYGGGLVAAALILVADALTLAAKVVADNGGDPAASKTLFSMGWEYFGVVNPAMAALTGATAVIGLRFGALPVWLSAIGVPLALASAFSGFFGGFFVFLSSLWLVPVSVVLFLRAGAMPSSESSARTLP